MVPVCGVTGDYQQAREGQTRAVAGRPAEGKAGAWAGDGVAAKGRRQAG